MQAEQHLFLSYPRRNEKEAAQLRRALEADGHVVWQDRSAIQGGDDWIKAIEAGLERAYAVVAVVSAAWPTSKWIRTEVLQAQRMNKIVIPVLVDGSQIPTELLTLHVISIYADQAEAGMESLLATLHSVRGSTESSFVAPTEPRLAEISYLDKVIGEYENWAELYTPLAGLGQLPAADSGPDLPGKLHWIDTGFVGDFANGDAGSVLEERTYENISTAIEEMRQLVILGHPGSGKTTTLWYVALQLAQLAKADPEQPLPVLIRLNLLEPGQLLTDFARQQLGPVAGDYPELLAQGRVAFLLDGLNELMNPDEHLPQVRELVQDCVRAGRIVIATCRDADYADDLDLGLDKRVRLSPLDPLRIRRFIDGYFEYLEHPGDGDRMFWQLAGESAEGYWQDFRVQVGDDPVTFWTAVRLPDGRHWGAGNTRWEAWVAQRQHPRSLLTLVSNPYLLLMATLLFARLRHIPDNRGRLFDEFVKQLLKERANVIDPAAADRLRGCLRSLAFHTMSIVGGGAPFDRAIALAHVPDPDDLHQARDADVLSEDASGIRFTHQLMQEYFAAAYLAEAPDRTDEFVASMTMAGDGTEWDEAIIFLGSIYPEDQGGISHIISLIAGPRPLLACRVTVESGKEAAVSAPARQSLIARCRQLISSPEQPVRYRYHVATELGRLSLPLPSDADHLVSIAGGSFDYLPNRRPVSDFLIARYPVTNREFRAFVDAQGYTTQRYWPGSWRWVGINVPEQAPQYFNDVAQPELSNPDAPVVGISWYEAQAFCRWKTDHLDPAIRRDGWRVRLPTEPEWLVAVRGAAGRSYPWGDSTSNLRNRCQFSGSRLPGPAPVGIYPAGESEEGVGDLLGNVYEFVAGAADQFLRGCRGGSWAHGADRLMDYQSETVSVDERTRSDVGFRYVYARR